MHVWGLASAQNLGAKALRSPTPHPTKPIPRNGACSLTCTFTKNYFLLSASIS